MNEPIETLFVPYVLGQLTPEERRQVDHYVARHPAAEERLALLLEERLDDLVDEIAPTAPSPAAREALLARVIADRSVEPPQSRPSLQGWINQRFTLRLAASAVMGLLLIVAVGAWINSLNQRLTLQADALARLEADNAALSSEVGALRDDLQTLQTENSVLIGRANELAGTVDDLEGDRAALLAELDGQADIVNLISSPHVHTVAVGGTDVRPEANGQLVVDPESGVALLIVSNLPALNEDQAYQVLLITGDGHTTHETFNVNAEGQNVVVIRAGQSLLTYDQLGISIEPAGGSPQRTGDIVMLAPLPSN